MPLSRRVPLFCALSMLALICTTLAYRNDEAAVQENSPTAQSSTKNQGDVARETTFWQSADYFNKITDYNAYLAIFPNGPHAQMAKDRIVALSAPAPAPAKSTNAAPASAPDAHETSLWETALRTDAIEAHQAYLTAYPDGIHAQTANDRPAALANAPVALPPADPQVSSTPKMQPAPVQLKTPKTEIGTFATTQAPNMSVADRIEVQQRLHAMQLYNGYIGGDFDAGARSAIAEWQKHHDFAATGELGPRQLAALRLESEQQFRKLTAISADHTPAVTRRPRQIVRLIALHHHIAPTVNGGSSGRSPKAGLGAGANVSAGAGTSAGSNGSGDGTGTSGVPQRRAEKSPKAAALAIAMKKMCPLIMSDPSSFDEVLVLMCKSGGRKQRADL